MGKTQAEKDQETIAYLESDSGMAQSVKAAALTARVKLAVVEATATQRANAALATLRAEWDTGVTSHRATMARRAKLDADHATIDQAARIDAARKLLAQAYAPTETTPSVKAPTETTPSVNA